MRTSIDTEIKENFRLIGASVLMFLFCITCPLFLDNLKHKLFKNERSYNKLYFGKRMIAISLFILVAVLVAKSHFFGINPMIESPLTSLATSLALNLKYGNYIKHDLIPPFDDKIGIHAISQKERKTPDKISSDNKANVILIILETTNHNFFRPQKSYLKKFKNLHNLSKNGLYFENFFSTFPRSSKSFFAILTGQYPLTSYQSIIKVAPDIKLPTIFSILKENGYATYAGYSGDFNYDRMADFLESRGVDKLVDIKSNRGRYKKISWCVDDELIYDKFIEWIESLGHNSPFLGLLIPMNSHHPFWTPKADYRIVNGNDKVSRYINAIHYQDVLIGKLFSFLEKTQRLKNTLIFITGDHGTVFNTLEQNNRDQIPYLINNNNIQVPLFIHMPYEPEYLYGEDVIGSHIDIMPTILDVLDIETEYRFQGKSLFDPFISERLVFTYTDYYQHIVNGLVYNKGATQSDEKVLKFSAMSSSFPRNFCGENPGVCHLIRNKIIEFDQYQNQRLLSYMK
jgi:phosphoglycerol transferase MdoB-like AlkP superfamily enzyme